MLDLEKVITVAAGMDPESLTMTAVAAELGVSTSALYRWVADREALLDLVSASMARRLLPHRAPTARDWQDWLVEWAYNARREFAAVPGFAVRVLTGPHRAAGHDQLHHLGVRAFTTAGAPHDYAHQCWYVFSTAVVGWIAAEHNAALPRAVPMQFDTLLRILLRGTNLDPGGRRSTPSRSSSPEISFPATEASHHDRLHRSSGARGSADPGGPSVPR